MADCDFHYRIVVNKHYREASGVTIDSFVKRGENADYVLRDDITGESYIDGRDRDFTDEGEIIISNEKMAEGIYILSYDPETERKTPIRITGAESIRIPHVDDTSSAEVNRMVGDNEFEIPNNSTVQGAVSLLDSHVKETDERISTRVGNLEDRVDEVEQDRIDEDINIHNKIDTIESQLDSRIDVLEGLEIEAVPVEQGSGLMARYHLVDANGTQRGEYINIPSIVSDVKLQDVYDGEAGRWFQYLVLTIPTTDENNVVSTRDISINVSSFLTQGEFKAGLETNPKGEVSVKIDSTSENFLTVSADGVKLSGVDARITGYTTQRINELNASITSATNSGLSVQVGENAGVLTGVTVNVTPGEIQSNVTALTTGGKVFTAIENAISALTTGITSQTVAGVSVEVGQVSGVVNTVAVNVTPGNVEEGVSALTTGGKVYTAIDTAVGDLETSVNDTLDNFRDVVIDEKVTEIFNERFGEAPYALRIGYDRTTKTIRLIYRKPCPECPGGYTDVPMSAGVMIDEVVSSGLKSAEVIVVPEGGGEYGGIEYHGGETLLKLVYVTQNREDEQHPNTEVTIYRNMSVMYDAFIVCSEDEYQTWLEAGEIDDNKFYYTYEE